MLLRRWELDPIQKISKFCPGQAQRLALVRALTPHPALLVLGEPATLLDPVALPHPQPADPAGASERDRAANRATERMRC